MSTKTPGRRCRPAPRRKGRRGLRILLILFLILAALYTGIRCFWLRPPEQKQETSQEAQEVSGDAEGPEADAEAEALKSHTERKDHFYTILVSGSDDGNGNSDTNILLAVDADGGSIYGVSIARDTKAVWGGKTHKINAAFGAGGMEKLAEVVGDQLGIPVDYTVSVDIQGFVALVDAIGGVDFDVPVDMHYEDPYQDLYIHISKGMQHLTGAEALKVVRFREGYATQDIGRMETQQAFLKAVAKQGTQAISMGAENIAFSTLPGTWKDPFIYLDADEVLTLVNEHLNPYVEDRTPEDLNIPT